MSKDLTYCPYCGADELRSGNSLHCWDIEYKCGCKIWGAISVKGHYEVDKECVNKKQ